MDSEKMRLLKKLNSLRIGEIESARYTDDEIAEKRLYFESLPVAQLKSVSEKRWKYEIERVFDHSELFRRCPDYGFLKLRVIYEYGL